MWNQCDTLCTVVQLIEQQQREKADILPICSKNGKMYLKSIPAQIGILDGTRYCLDLKPNPLIVFDWKDNKVRFMTMTTLSLFDNLHNEPQKDTHSFLIDVYQIMSGDDKNRDFSSISY